MEKLTQVLKIDTGSDLEGAIIKAYFHIWKEDAERAAEIMKAIKSFTNQFNIKRELLIRKLTKERTRRKESVRSTERSEEE